VKDAEDIDLGPLIFFVDPKRNSGLGTAVRLTNDGKGFSVTSANLRSQYLQGGGLYKQYRLAQFHFHWGPVDLTTKVRQGAEHTINGRRSPAELHLVYYSTRYPNIGAAIRSNDYEALAVVGVIIESDVSIKTAPKRRKNTCMDCIPPLPKDVIAKKQKARKALFKKIAASLAKIVNPKDKTTVNLNSYTLQDLLPEDTRHFWSYKGSLTTPDYNEIVAWRVLEDPIVIPAATLKKLSTTVKGDKGKVVEKNYRDPQPLDGRKVYFHRDNKKGMRKPFDNEKCVEVKKSDTYDCKLDYVKAVSRSFVEDCPIPSCEHDNSYSPMQCHNDECWCARKDGKQIGSRVKFATRNLLNCDSVEVRGRVSCQRMRAINILKEGKFAPKCHESNGSFKSKQCYKVSHPLRPKNYCWCTLKNGARIPGTLSAEGTKAADKIQCDKLTNTQRLCQGDKIGFYRHPANCQFYVFCHFDFYRICHCPRGMYYDVWSKLCKNKQSNNNC